jgi:hypothetical protein
MKDFDLCRELSKKLCKDLGCTPFSVGKAGLTHDDLVVHSHLKVEDENGDVKVVPMWYGEAAGTQGKTCCLLATLDPDPDALEIVCVIGFKDFKGQILENAVRCAFQFDWADESDGGTLLIWMGNGVERWVEVSLSQRLQLALGFETMVQEGILWNEEKNVPEIFRENLSSVLEALDA